MRRKAARSRAARVAALGCAAAALVWPGQAAAHGLVVRADLPIPEWLFGWAATLVLIASFVALAVLWPAPRLQADSWRPLAGPLSRALASRAASIVCGTLGVLALALVVYSGLAGEQLVSANFAPNFVYVVFWVGLVVVSVLFGDVYRAFNPWRALGRAFGWIATRIARRPLPEPMPYPERLGRWPAAIGLTAFVWLELAADGGETPRNVAIGALVYTLVSLVGMALYGVEAWTARGDAFSVYFNLFSRLSPLEKRDGRIGLRRALSGLPSLDAGPGTVAVLMVMIGSVSFDGLSGGQLWNSALVPRLQDAWGVLGLGPAATLELTFGTGLVASILAVAGFYRLGVVGARSVGGGKGVVELSRSFVHSLVPIALAYVLAHYISLLLVQGQSLIYLVSDPLGRGSNLLGTADVGIDYGIVGQATYWYLQVAFVVAGHVAGLALAHDRALALYDDARQAVRSQYWMLAVMVGFTCLALWLLASANQS